MRSRDTEELLADLAHAGARVTVACGGAGGNGNRRYATARWHAPETAQVGESGDELWLELRLKLVADAALLGFPNAGKSSLLRRISNAKPRVADYPFTTVEPVLGTVESGDGRQLTVADVPGLLEGASTGVGLGHEFLAHLERARLLIHLVEADADPAEIVRRRDAINRELRLHGGGLAERPQLFVISKIDLLEAGERALVAAAAGAAIACSSATGDGVDELKRCSFSPSRPRRAPAEPVEPELADSSSTGRRRPPAAASASCATPGRCAWPAATSRSGPSGSIPTTIPTSPRLRANSRELGVERGPARRRRPPGRRHPGRGAPVHVQAEGRVSRIGVFGGQFDPPHNGHMMVVRSARDQLGLDRVLVVPARVPAAPSPPRRRPRPATGWHAGQGPGGPRARWSAAHGR